MTVDLFFFVVLLVFGVLGLLSGFWMQLMRLGVLVGACLLAGVVGRPAGPWLADTLGIPVLMGQALGTFAAFLILYLVLSTVGWSVLRAVRRTKDVERAKARRHWDRIAGGAFGAGKAFLILLLLLNALVLVEHQISGPLRRAEVGWDESAMVRFAREHNLLGGLHLPVVGDVKSLSRLGSDPAFREKVARDPQMQRILAHPKIQSLLGDRAVLQASQRGDVTSLMGNPRLNEALQDPEVVELLSQIDLSRIEE